MAYGADPAANVTLNLAAEKGAGEGELGALRQLTVSGAGDTQVETIRYGVTHATDQKSLSIALEIHCTVSGAAQIIEDTLTVTPGASDMPSWWCKARRAPSWQHP